MFLDSIRAALGELQEDPERPSAWQTLETTLTSASPDGEDGEELSRLLEAAAAAHRAREEWEAFSRLLKMEASLQPQPEDRAKLMLEIGRVYQEELLNEAAAIETYADVLKSHPDDPEATSRLSENAAKQERWEEMKDAYLSEAEGAADDVYKSSMLMRAAEMRVRFADDVDVAGTTALLEEALSLDPSNLQAAKILEQHHRRSEDWEGALAVIGRVGRALKDPAARLHALLRQARLLCLKIGDRARAATLYELIFELDASHFEARRFLDQFYTETEAWDGLVALSERALGDGYKSPERLGDTLQIAMLHWKKRGDEQAAAEWFSRALCVEPAVPLALSFFREQQERSGDSTALIEVLTSAQKSLPEGPEKSELSSETARLLETHSDGRRAIEEYKAILRHEPENVAARQALKRIYRDTGAHNALVELLRLELERLPRDDTEDRLAILWEVAGAYRDGIRSESALVKALSQILQVDRESKAAHQELMGLYQSLGRWRELLTTQEKLAELSDDPEEKKELLRAVAHAWLERNNVQNATKALEALLSADPTDGEATERLGELYRKRRAFPALYDLLQARLERAEGEGAQEIRLEMAQLAGDRLQRPEEAISLLTRALEYAPEDSGILEALERLAEKNKQWDVLADALERQVEAEPSGEDGQAQHLQKLAGVYETLGDEVRATNAWRRLLSVQPGHSRALRVLRDLHIKSADYDALSELYLSQDDTAGLAEVLNGAAERAKEAAARVELSYRAAALYAEPLGNLDRAQRCLERVLATDEKEVRAAAQLVQFYERGEKWAKLPPLYELLLASAEDVEAQLGWLERLTEVSRDRMNDLPAAVGFAVRAYEMSPGVSTLETLEAQVGLSGDWARFAETLSARLEREEDDPGTPLSSEEQLLLRGKLAVIYADRLGKTDDGLSMYRSLLEDAPLDADIRDAFEALAREADRADQLRWLAEFRVDNARDDDERAELMSDAAALELRELGDKERAVAFYELALELQPQNSAALATLPELLISKGETAKAVAFMERRREALVGDERADLELQLAVFYTDSLERPADAVSAVRHALTRKDPRVQELLNKLLVVEEVRLEAAGLLAELSANQGDAEGEASALEVLLDATEDPDKRADLLANIIDIHQEKRGEFGAAFEWALRAATESVSLSSLWDRAEQLAVVADRLSELVNALKSLLEQPLPEGDERELAERAARLFEDRFGDPLSAVPYLERVLKLDPESETAFGRLKDILTGAERWAELSLLYDQACESARSADREIELLCEVALVCEEMVDAPERATRYYERILSLDENHVGSITALERLYERQGAHEPLAALLCTRIAHESGEVRSALELRVAELFITQLGKPADGLERLETLLLEDGEHARACELAEQVMLIPDLRRQAAALLQTVYEGLGRSADLARILSIRLENVAAEGDDAGDDSPSSVASKRDLLSRLADIRHRELDDDDGAFEALSALVPLDPFDTSARERLVELSRGLGKHAELATILENAALAVDSDGLRGQLLMEAASISEDFLSDATRAETLYRQVLSVDARDPMLVLPAARNVERLAEADGRAEDVAEALETQVLLESEPDLRREILERLGALYAGALGDEARAGVSFRALLEEDPGNEAALLALDGLLSASQDWPGLRQIVQQRLESATDEQVRRELRVRAARLDAERLDAPEDAIDAWRAVLDESPEDVEALDALGGLFHSEERWTELEQILEARVGLSEGADRVTALVSLGKLRGERLNVPGGALSAFGEALRIDAGSEEARALVWTLAKGDEPMVRSDATTLLKELYEAEAHFERLLEVMELEARDAPDVSSRLEVLEQALRVAEGPLENTEKAWELALQGLELAAPEPEAEAWVAHVERLATSLERRAPQALALVKVMDELTCPDVQLQVALRIAELSRAGDEAARAVEFYERALEIHPDHSDCLEALDALYASTEAPEKLHDIIERRAGLSDDDAQRRGFELRRAVLLSDALNDRKGAIDVYEGLLEGATDATVNEALERLYGLEERWDDLTDLFQRQIDAGLDHSADLHVRSANVAMERLDDPYRALDELEAALNFEVGSVAAREALERLLKRLDSPDLKTRAASLLEPVYLAGGHYELLRDLLKIRLDVAVDDPALKREIGLRLAELEETQLEDPAAALEALATLLADDPLDEESRRELERLALSNGLEERLANVYAGILEGLEIEDDATAALCTRTAELLSLLEQPKSALSLYQRALNFSPESRVLFTAIDTLLVRLGDNPERIRHFEASLDRCFEADVQAERLHVLAGLYREAGELEKSVEFYRRLLEVDETESAALDELGMLLARLENWSELAAHLVHRAEIAETAETQAGFRLELAGVFGERLFDSEGAVDQLEEVLRLVPGHGAAVDALEAWLDDADHKHRVIDLLQAAYEETDAWQKLVRLNERRLELSDSELDRVGLLRENARLLEERGDAPAEARAVYATALELDPDDAGIRGEYERLAEEGAAYDEWVALYESIAGLTPAESGRVDFLRVAARVHDEHRDDPRSTLSVYMKIWEADPTDSALGEKIESFAMMLGDWRTLVRLLQLREEAALEDSERGALGRRRGRVLRDMLDDPTLAIEAFEKSLTYDTEDLETLDALIALYAGRAEAPERLAELYQTRIEFDTDADARFEHLIALADLMQGELADPGRAIASLDHAQEIRPGDLTVMVRLGELYAADERWTELLSNLSARLDLAESVEERGRLRKHMARVLSEELQRFEDAVEIYRAVLDDGADEEALQSLLALVVEHEDLRSVAGPILIQVLRAAGDRARLAEVLELRLSVQTDASARAETLQELAAVHEHLEHPEQALGAVLRALSERPDLSELHAEAERYSSAFGSFTEYAEVLQARAEGTFDAELACDLFARLGAVFRDKLQDLEAAAAAYRSAVEQVGEQPLLLQALDSVYESLNDSEHLLDIIERRALLAETDDERAALYCRLAECQIASFGNKEQGLASVEKALGLCPNSEQGVKLLEELALDADLFEAASGLLETLYREASRAADLALLYARRVKLAPSVDERMHLREQFASVLETECGDAGAAEELLEAGLMESADPLELVKEIERLASISGHWSRAASCVLEVAQGREELLPEAAVGLCLTAARWLGDGAEDPRGALSAVTAALKIEPESATAMDAMVAFRRSQGEDPEQRAELVEALCARARLEAPGARGEFYRDAREACRALGDGALCERVLREALDAAPRDDWALSELMDLAREAGDQEALLEWTLRRADIAEDAAFRGTLWREAAELSEALSDAARATELYEKLFSADPADFDAVQALERLFFASGRFDKVRDTLLGHIDVAADKAPVQIRLARIATEELGDPALAIELYESSLESGGSAEEPWTELPGLYESGERFEDLVTQLSRELETLIAGTRTGDEVALVERLACLAEERLSEPRRAIQIYTDAVLRHPDKTEWLETLVRLHEEQGEPGLAAQHLEQLLAASDGPEVLSRALRLADQCVQISAPERAIAALERAQAAEPTDGGVRERLRALYEQTGAWEALCSLLVVDADGAEDVQQQVALFRRASALRAEHLEDASGAVELLERALKVAPDERALLLELCDAYSAAGRAPDAIRALEQVVASYGGRRSKELADVHRRIADACLTRGETERALSELDLAFRIEPGNLKVLDQLGRLALEHSDLKKAQQMFRALLLQKLDEHAPITKPEVFMYLGEVHAGLGEIPKAKQMLERALQAAPDLERARELLAGLTD